jgi:two-component system response regulator GlrR
LADLDSREKFRDDLLYRLDVLSVNLPPLRSRDEDAIIASMQILARLSEEMDEGPKILGQNVIDTILDYDWPGNFRELESSLTRAFLMTEEHVIRNPSLLFSDTDGNDQALASQVGSFSSEKQALISRFEKQYIERVLTRTSGNISEAARIAQKERRAFSRLMDKHGIRKEKFVA